MRISEKTYGKMPDKLKRLFSKLPNPGSDEVVGLFPASESHGVPPIQRSVSRFGGGAKSEGQRIADSGSAARFFYCAKASRSERNAGLEGMPTKSASELTGRKADSRGLSGSEEHGNATNPYANGGSVEPSTNHHPTVKPLKLLRYLARLTKTPTGGVVLDPFMGSGTTGIAAVKEGRDFIGIEIDAEYLNIARRRIEYAQQEPRQLKLAAPQKERQSSTVSRDTIEGMTQQLSLQTKEKEEI